MKRDHFATTMNRLLACSACALLLGSGTSAFAAAGDLEVPATMPSAAITAGDDEIKALAVQPDGKIVAVGYGSDGGNGAFAIVRYRTDGQLDTSFGVEGLVTTDFGSNNDQANAVAIQTDGKIVVAGFAYIDTGYQFALVRYTASGGLDTTFGDGDGRVTVAVHGAYDFANAVAIQPDGKILVAGSSMDAGQSDFVLMRFTADGQLDTTFDTDGVVTTAMAPGLSGGATAIALQPDRKIVVAGYADTTSLPFSSHLVLVRYLEDGSVDPAFGPVGIITAQAAVVTRGMDMALQADGKIVVVGESSSYNAELPGIITDSDLLVARFNIDGSPDTGFSADGIATVSEAGLTVARSVSIQPDGKVLAAGSTGTELYVARFATDGNLDSAFGSGGRRSVAIGEGAGANAVAVQGNGTLLVGGYVVNSGSRDLQWVRLLATDDNDDKSAEPWDLKPNTFAFSDQTQIAAGTQAVSDAVTISGLQSGISVLARPVGCAANGCEIALNGSSDYRTFVWVSNGDTITVRHTAAATDLTSTAVVVGGVSAKNSPLVAHCSVDVTSDTFISSQTAATGGTDTASGGGGGGGDFGVLGLLGLAVALRRRR